MAYPRVAQLKTRQQFSSHLEELGVEVPLDSELETGPEAPLARTHRLKDRTIGNRFAVLPMEGWDGTEDGRPSELTIRRWRRFGESGAKLIWGGEAVAVRFDGRANPNQLVINENTMAALESLRSELVSTHRDRFGRTDDLLVGLQLTHSGRFSRPREKWRLEPRTLYRHPILDDRFSVDKDTALLRDEEIERLADDFVRASVQAWKVGFHFVDLKHCHGYLGHEFLSAVDRRGPYGGSLENRTKFLQRIVNGIRSEAPELEIGVRLSAFDWIPYRPGLDNVGEPEPLPETPYRHAFGGDGTGLGIDLREPKAFLDLLRRLGVELVCISAGSPYYVPHIQRPALFPPSDGYDPPEDPLVGVARQIRVTAELKRHRSELLTVGSGYSYLQEWLGLVGQAAVRTGMVDFVGLGRIALSYPGLPADLLQGRPPQRKLFCRTFSDCTTGPRNGLVSGCFPLDPFYREHPDNARLAEIKKTPAEKTARKKG